MSLLSRVGFIVTEALAWCCLGHAHRRVVDGDLLQQFLQLPRALRERVVGAMWTRLVWRQTLAQSPRPNPVGTPEPQPSSLVEAAMEVADAPDACAGGSLSAGSLQLFASADVLFAIMELAQHALSLATL